MPAEDPTSKEKIKHNTRLTKLMAMFAHVDNVGNVQPHVLSDAGKLLLEVMNAREMSRIYGYAALNLPKKAVVAGNTHYLGCATSITANGYTDYTVTCLSNATYRS